MGATRLVARDDAMDFARKAVSGAGTLYDFAATQPAAETMEGRRKIYVIPGPESARWVVRHLSHGGLLAPLTGDRFLKVGRPHTELEHAVAEANEREAAKLYTNVRWLNCLAT